MENNSGLNKNYQFENFIKNDGNVWARAGALAVADNLGGPYNPLYLYGKSSIGKTHLLHAIGNRVLEKNPESQVYYISAKDISEQAIQQLRQADLDLLLVDDVQFFSEKEADIQEKFFYLFNSLHENNKQIVFSSDCEPDKLTKIEERLVSRFKWGLRQEME